MSSAAREGDGLRRAAAYLDARSRGIPGRVEDRSALEAMSALLEAAFAEPIREEVLEYLRAAVAAEQVVEAVAGEPTAILSTQDLLERARLDGEIRRRVFEHPLLDAQAVAEQLGSRSANRQRAAKLRREGKLVGIKQGNQYRYPAFQLDPDRRCIYRAAAKANERLDAARDPWGVASWWLRPREVLGGQAPKDLLGTERETDIEALVEADLQSLG